MNRIIRIQKLYYEYAERFMYDDYTLVNTRVFHILDQMIFGISKRIVATHIQYPDVSFPILLSTFFPKNWIQETKSANYVDTTSVIWDIKVAAYSIPSIECDIRKHVDPILELFIIMIVESCFTAHFVCPRLVAPMLHEQINLKHIRKCIASDPIIQKVFKQFGIILPTDVQLPNLTRAVIANHEFTPHALELLRQFCFSS